MEYMCSGSVCDTVINIFKGNQIGGCVTVIAVNIDGVIRRIMIDYGQSLPGCETEEFSYPWDRAPVDAVLFTHYHGDHAGRILEIPESIPIYMGTVARDVMLNIHMALLRAEGLGPDHEKIVEILSDSDRVKTFKWNGKCYESIPDIPGFIVTPFSVDHSAYDAYMFLIETPDRKILHTGDFRGHGRRGKALLPVISHYVRDDGRRDVDVLIIEGTMMTRLGEPVMSEMEMQREAVNLFKRHRCVFLICSSTNFDSLSSFIKAAESNGIRTYCYSRYLHTQLKSFSDAAGRFSDIYKFKKIHVLDLDKQLDSGYWDRTNSQKEIMREKGFLTVIKADDFCEKYVDAFLDLNPVIIYSMWSGYINPEHKAYNPVWGDFLKRQEAKGVEIITMHTSGHATPDFISRVINAVNPMEAIIPIHTEAAEKFSELDIGDNLKKLIRI